MTFKGGEFSYNDYYHELKERAVRNKADNIGAYKELMENLIQERKSYGFLDENEDWPQLAHDLMIRWPEVEEEVKRRTGRPIS